MKTSRSNICRNRQASKLETQGRVTVESEGYHLLAGFPLAWGLGGSIFCSSWNSSDWMRPTHIMEGNLLYLKSTSLNVNLIQNVLSKYPEWRLIKYLGPVVQLNWHTQLTTIWPHFSKSLLTWSHHLLLFPASFPPYFHPIKKYMWLNSEHPPWLIHNKLLFVRFLIISGKILFPSQVTCTPFYLRKIIFHVQRLGCQYSILGATIQTTIFPQPKLISHSCKVSHHFPHL